MDINNTHELNQLTTAGDPTPSTPQPSTSQPEVPVNPQPASPPLTTHHSSLDTFSFPLRPGETPRAHSAFVAYFQLGHTRTLAVLAEQIGESPGTIKNWSSRYNWSERIQSFNSGLLQQHAEAEAAAQRQRSADWTKRMDEYREQHWIASQKLLAAARCFLESYDDTQVQKMTLAEVSRAIDISSRIGLLALKDPSTEEQPPALTPLQIELAANLKRMFEPASTSRTTNTQPSTINPQPTQ